MNMGAKDTVKFKLRRPTFKCDVCAKKFLSAQALKNHNYYVHKNKSKAKHNELNTLLGKSVKNIEKKSAEESDLVLEVEPTSVPDVRKIEYECPQCKQCFSVYFTAFRHIQKNHCVNSRGKKVPPNSIEMIKPVRIEVCMKCNLRLRSNDPHSCSDATASVNPMATYICLGCKQQFLSLNLFEMHVLGLHSDDLETLFFPSWNEFNLWKEDVESQTKVKYLILSKTSASSGSTKHIFHCTYMGPSTNDEDNVVHFCPSAMLVTDFSKSIQVHFFTQHFGHECKYALPKEFKKYLINRLIKEPTPLTEPMELKNLYMDFKTLMEFIILESTKCDKSSLEALNTKAQEMLAIVNKDEPVKMAKRKMTDEQISETLETLDTKKMKGDNPDVEQTILNMDPEPSAPVIMNTFSLAPVSNTEEKSTRRKQKIKHIEENPPLNVILGNSPGSSMSSFNDSYREFVDKNFNVKTEKSVLEDSKTIKGKEVEKDIKTNEIQSANESSVEKTVKKPNIVRKKKKVMKTKMGQFKPSLSPKKADIVHTERRSSIGKVDFEYEVREQENDCNILVLKI